MCVAVVGELGTENLALAPKRLEGRPLFVHYTAIMVRDRCA